jgi:hypothetical protein
VAATKTYTTQLIALGMLVAEMSHDAQLLARIDQFPAAARLAFELEEAAEHMAEDLAQGPACLVLARGFNYATAFKLHSSSRSWPIYSPSPTRRPTLCMARRPWRTAVCRPS